LSKEGQLGRDQSNACSKEGGKHRSLTLEETITRDTHDAIASKFAPKVDIEWWRSEFEKFKRLLPENKVLDLGCGTGSDTHLFLEEGLNYVGVDISQGMLREARKRVPSASFVRMDMYSLGFESDSFDGFWAPTSLYLIPKKKIDTVLQEIKRVTKNGAVGFVVVPEGHTEGLTPSYKYPQYLTYLARYGKLEFREKLKSNGFDLLEYAYMLLCVQIKWSLILLLVHIPANSIADSGANNHPFRLKAINCVTSRPVRGTSIQFLSAQ
jgi:ubiquinone/menaquinone biosynthesis C-methylase UbiE